MKAVDPTIQIGLCSYHFYRDYVAEMLEICGEDVDFLADRVCEPCLLYTSELHRLERTHPKVSPGMAAGVNTGRMVSASEKRNCTGPKARFIATAARVSTV